MVTSRRLTPDYDYYADPVEGQVYELVSPIITRRPDGIKLVFTHVRCEHYDDMSQCWMFEPLVDAEQPASPQDYVLRYNLDYVRYGITYERFMMHRHVKLPRRVSEMEQFAIVLNTALADAARARRRSERASKRDES